MSDSPIELDDNTDGLPDGWRWLALGEISEVISRTIPDGATLLLSAGDAELWVVPDSDEVVITARSPLLAGKMIVVSGGGPNDGLPDVDPVFLTYWLTDAGQDVLQRYAVGRPALPRTTFQHLRKIRVPLPPIDEQQRIAAKLRDEFREANEAVLRAVQDAVRRYQKDRLRAFAEGKITEQWLESNPTKLAIEESLRPVLNHLRYFAGQDESREQGMIHEVGAILAEVQSEPTEAGTPSAAIAAETAVAPLPEVPVVTAIAISAGLDNSFQLRVEGRPPVSLDGDYYWVFGPFVARIASNAPGEIVPWARIHEALNEEPAPPQSAATSGKRRKPKASDACRKAVLTLRRKLEALGHAPGDGEWISTDRGAGCRLNADCVWEIDEKLKKQVSRKSQSADGRRTDPQRQAEHTVDYRTTPGINDT